MLRLITLKQRKSMLMEDVREVPVYRTTLRSIRRYTKKIRSRIIKGIEERTGKKFNDHGYVFISETTGEQLKPGSITVYFNTWGKVIGASGNVISHAFRHSYITEKIEMLIQLFELQDASDLKAKFASENSFRMRILDWTGHKSIRSLENYIHLAFDGISGVSGVLRPSPRNRHQFSKEPKKIMPLLKYSLVNT
jgi:integrase